MGLPGSMDVHGVSARMPTMAGRGTPTATPPRVLDGCWSLAQSRRGPCYGIKGSEDDLSFGVTKGIEGENEG